IDRIGRGSFAVRNWSACFLGAIQPGPIARIAKEADDDGLLQRLMYCVPARQDTGLDRAPDHAAIERYEALFARLAALDPGGEAVAPRRPSVARAGRGVRRRFVVAARHLAPAAGGVRKMARPVCQAGACLSPDRRRRCTLPRPAVTAAACRAGGR